MTLRYLTYEYDSLGKEASLVLIKVKYLLSYKQRKKTIKTREGNRILATSYWMETFFLYPE